MKPSLEDLVWKGSQLPVKFSFANRAEIHDEIKGIKKKWQDVDQNLQTTVRKHQIVLADLKNITGICDELNSWTEKCDKISMEFERYYLDKDMNDLIDLKKQAEV